jgi:hypothetical protein
MKKKATRSGSATGTKKRAMKDLPSRKASAVKGGASDGRSYVTGRFT